MPRPPRVQFAGAIYHIVTRGDGRRALFHDESHYDRFTRGLAEEVLRSAWEVLAYCWMPNQSFVQYDTLYETWRGECGGADPAAAYRRYVREGLFSAPENPLQSALHEVNPQDYVGFRSTDPGRDMAALLCRRLTRATLAQLSDRLGLTYPDSSTHLVRRAKKRERESSSYRQAIAKAESHLLPKTENQV